MCAVNRTPGPLCSAVFRCETWRDCVHLNCSDPPELREETAEITAVGHVHVLQCDATIPVGEQVSKQLREIDI